MNDEAMAHWGAVLLNKQTKHSNHKSSENRFSDSSISFNLHTFGRINNAPKLAKFATLYKSIGCTHFETDFFGCLSH